MNESENFTPGNERSVRASRARLGFVITGLGLGATLAYLISRRARLARVGEEEQPRERVSRPEHIVDDRGTGQDKAARILRNLRDQAFESSDVKLAIALGRSADEIEAFHSGRATIDDDVVMKARGIAMHRGIQVE